MKLRTDTTPVETMGGTGTIDFGIRQEDLAKVLSILGQNFYSDPARSMVRELMTNAIDAHIDANNLDTPVSIYLPSSLNPQFRIRDYGTGMSPEFLQKIYVNFGASTKASSNKSNGAFGLGSKSPFAVSSTWTMVSYYNGMKYTYMAYNSDSTGRQMMPAGEEATNQPNGVEVIVPCKKSYREDMEKACRFYGRWWGTRPLIDEKPRPDDWWGSLETAFEGTDWKMMRDNIDRERYYNNSNVFLVGDVPYPIEQHHSALSSLNPDLKYYLSRNLFLKFGTGELQPTPNREDIVFDDAAVALITARLRKIQEEIETSIQKSIETAKSLLEAIDLKRQGDNNVPGTLGQKIFTWKGYKVAYTYDLGQGFKVLKYDSLHHCRGQNVSAQIVANKIYKSDAVYVYNDLGKKKSRMQAVRTLLKQGKTVYLIEPIEYYKWKEDNNNNANRVRVDCVGTKSDFSKEVEYLYFGDLSGVVIDPEFGKSNTPKQPRKKRDTSLFKAQVVAEDQQTYRRGIRSCLKDVDLELDPSTPKYFLPFFGGTIEGSLTTEGFRNLIARNTISIDVIETNKYGSYNEVVRKSYNRYSVGDDKQRWLHLFRYIKKNLGIDHIFLVPVNKIEKLGDNWIPLSKPIQELSDELEWVALEYLRLVDLQRLVFDPARCETIFSSIARSNNARVQFIEWVGESLGHGDANHHYNSDGYVLGNFVRETSLLRHKLQDKDLIEMTNKYLVTLALLGKDLREKLLPHKQNSSSVDQLEELKDAAAEKYPLLNISQRSMSRQEKAKVFIDYITNCH